jgi:phycoerythrin-associated linker protein
MTLWVTDTAALELRPNATTSDRETVIRAVYKQVLGNAHLMEGDRLVTAEAMLCNGDITVRDFVRRVAQSDLYRSRFFTPASQYRFIELNCKHLLGRAPQDQAEIAQHVQTYAEQGYDAEINSYIDSAEYLANFGENTVPQARGSQTQAGNKNVTFNRTFALLRGNATSDSGTKAQLISDLANNLSTKIKLPATGTGAYSSIQKRFRITVNKASYGARVTQSKATFEVGYEQMAQKIQNIQRTGGKILSITEVA